MHVIVPSATGALRALVVLGFIPHDKEGFTSPPEAARFAVWLLVYGG